MQCLLCTLALTVSKAQDVMVGLEQGSAGENHLQQAWWRYCRILRPPSAREWSFGAFWPGLLEGLSQILGSSWVKSCWSIFWPCWCFLWTSSSLVKKNRVNIFLCRKEALRDFIWLLIKDISTLEWMVSKILNVKFELVYYRKASWFAVWNLQLKFTLFT